MYTEERWKGHHVDTKTPVVIDDGFWGPRDNGAQGE